MKTNTSIAIEIAQCTLNNFSCSDLNRNISTLQDNCNIKLFAKFEQSRALRRVRG